MPQNFIIAHPRAANTAIAAFIIYMVLICYFGKLCKLVKVQEEGVPRPPPHHLFVVREAGWTRPPHSPVSSHTSLVAPHWINFQHSAYAVVRFFTQNTEILFDIYPPPAACTQPEPMTLERGSLCVGSSKGIGKMTFRRHTKFELINLVEKHIIFSDIFYSIDDKGFFVF